MKGVSYFSLKNKWITTGKNNYEKNKTIWSIFLKKKSNGLNLKKYFALKIFSNKWRLYLWTKYVKCKIAILIKAQ